MIPIPTSAPADLFASISDLISDLWPLIALAIGIPLAFFVISIIVQLAFPNYANKYMSGDDEPK
jgi:uncharacterized membrane protein